MTGAIPGQPPGFLPRPALLAELNRADQGAPMIHVVTGAGGVGKTQLAAAHARAKLAGGWRLVAWVNTEDTGSLLAGLSAVADAAGLSYGGAGHAAADAGQAVRQRLEADGERCLLVFDNVADPDVVRPFAPARGAAHVLITTRHPAANLGTSIRVDVFSEDEALAFLDGRTGMGEAGAAVVATELGYLPLALAQAAAAMASENIGYLAYLAQLRAVPVEEYLGPRPDQPYPPGLAESVLVSLEAVEASDQDGLCARLMAITAVLSAAGVRRGLLYAAGEAGVLASGGHRVVDAATVDQALEKLVERSLLSFSLDGQTVIMHRPASQVVREALARHGRLTSVCRAATSVLAADADRLVTSQDRLIIRDIPGQVAALATNTKQADGTDEELADALLRLGLLALSNLIELGGSAAQAIALGKYLTADLEQELGRDHPYTLNARNSLASAYQSAGRSAEAISMFQVTLATRERVLGSDHSDTLKSRTNLAKAYRDAGQVSEAIPLFEQTLAAQDRLLGPDYPDTMRSRNDLANAYRKTGQVARAIPLLEQILASRERLLGTEDPRTLGSRNNLAVAYREVGRTAEAIPLFEQTLTTCERLLDADDPRTLAARTNLSLAHQDLDRSG